MTHSTNADAPSCPVPGRPGRYFTGLTKREEFAKAAMQGLAVSTFPMLEAMSSEDYVKAVTKSSVELADALLEALAVRS